MEFGSNWMDFHGILIFEYFSKICRENSSFIKIRQEENQNIYFLSNNLFFEHRADYDIMLKSVEQPGSTHMTNGTSVLHAGYLKLQTHTE
jgi:hypothetical protein